MPTDCRKENKIHANLMIGTNLADTYQLEGEHLFRFVQVFRLHDDAAGFELLDIGEPDADNTGLVFRTFGLSVEIGFQGVFGDFFTIRADVLVVGPVRKELDIVFAVILILVDNERKRFAINGFDVLVPHFAIGVFDLGQFHANLFGDTPTHRRIVIGVNDAVFTGNLADADERTTFLQLGYCFTNERYETALRAVGLDKSYHL
jgi:hypothetical protein